MNVLCWVDYLMILLQLWQLEYIQLPSDYTTESSKGHEQCITARKISQLQNIPVCDVLLQFKCCKLNRREGAKRVRMKEWKKEWKTEWARESVVVVCFLIIEPINAASQTCLSAMCPRMEVCSLSLLWEQKQLLVKVLGHSAQRYASCQCTLQLVFSLQHAGYAANKSPH